MPSLRRLLHRLANVVAPRRAERELAREMAAHLALLEEKYQRRGLSDSEARDAARRAFGGIEQAKERQREARSIRWLDDLAQDVRYTLG